MLASLLEAFWWLALAIGAIIGGSQIVGLVLFLAVYLMVLRHEKRKDEVVAPAIGGTGLWDPFHELIRDLLNGSHHGGYHLARIVIDAPRHIRELMRSRDPAQKWLEDHIDRDFSKKGTLTTITIPPFRSEPPGMPPIYIDLKTKYEAGVVQIAATCSETDSARIKAADHIAIAFG